MRYIVLSGLFALALTIVCFAPQAEASDFGPGMASMASLAVVGNAHHMATGGGDLRAFFEWLKHLLIKYFGAGGYGGGGGGGGGGYNGGTTPKGSVPIPGTLLLFGGGFASLVFWASRQSRL